MENNYNRIIYKDGKMWINHRIDGFGPDSCHYHLCHAILRAARYIKKYGDGQLTVKDQSDYLLFNAEVKKT